ncbi:MAG: peptidylprolyl isomerase [Phycisphaerales bacterium]|nr:MAG: peptidylprolyl isomerase [Phycisphaerales bacterium]
MPHVKNLAIVALIGSTATAVAQQTSPAQAIPGVEAHIRLVSGQTPLGKPVWVQFLIENTSDDPITLTVPGCEPQIPSPETGLPITHVFSGGSTLGVSVTTETGQRWDQPLGYRRPSNAPILMIAPRGTVGTTLDLREYFSALRAAGRYRLNWAPYGGALVSETLTVTVAPFKQAEIVTDDGTMTLRFFYESAPANVANFIELAREGFYNSKRFHRLEPGYLLQGGCPRGDGTGIRSDGVRLPSEFNNKPHQKGSVSMALLNEDPDSASCQFFICNTRQKDWDGRYTVFAQLVGEESFATLDKLMATPVDADGRPRRTLYMHAVRIVDAPSGAYVDTP